MGDEDPTLLEERANHSAEAGDYAAAVALRERAFARWRARGDLRRAAYLAAYQIAFDHLALFGNQAVAQAGSNAARTWQMRRASAPRQAGSRCPAPCTPAIRRCGPSSSARRRASRSVSGTPTSSSTPSPTPV